MRLTILALVLSPLLSKADQPLDVKLGLWETVSRTELPALPASRPQIPPDALARMTPEQRARIEAILKSRGTPGAITTRSCLTRESLEHGLNLRNDQACTYKLTGSSAIRQQIQVECRQGQAREASGELTLERVDAGHIEGTMVMKPAAGSGNIKTTFDSRWVSADCGRLKPNPGK